MTTNVLNLNNSVFKTNIMKGGLSRRARKAMATPLEVSVGVEMSYDDCESVDGGVAITAIIKGAGLIGSIASIACTVLLTLDQYTNWFKFSWIERLGLKIARFVGDVFSTIACISNMMKSKLANVVAKIVCGRSGLIVDANIIAMQFKAFGSISHFASLFQ